MKKRVSIILAAVVICVSMFSGVVSAVEPGASDYVVTKEVKVADVAGNNVELVNVDSGTIVTIPKTALPEGVTAVKFEATEIAKTEVAYTIAEAAASAAGAKDFVLFNFSLTDTVNNTSISNLNGKISVTVACPKGMNTVFYYNEATGKVEDMGAKVSADGKFITFETSHFSYYALANVEGVKLPDATTPPSTGVATSGIIGGLLLLAAAGLLFASKKAFCK